MQLESGQELLHYRLVEKLGEGGMGVVWKAIDTTLDREVAIKVLPAGFAEDAERLARFQREAKTLASLAHPNIVPIYGLHEHENTRFLAMELIVGEDLSDRLAAGPLPLHEALEIAGQIAQALAAAHDNGVVHRDLKPANVRVGPDGRARVLDFGLAKAVEGGLASGHSPTLSPTVTSAGSIAGIIMGTAAYMSPEQARGKPVDRQTDVWAFGCLLYELLSVRPAYSGETVTDVLTAILHRDPDWDALPALPAGVHRVLRGCLQKEQRDRFRDVGDVALLLREAQEPSNDAGAAGTSSTSRTSGLWRVLAVVSSLVALASIGLLAVGGFRTGGGAPAAARIAAIAQLTDQPGKVASPSLSADAEQLLYVATDGGDRDIFLQRVGGENPINLTANYDGDDFEPAFSPDRQQIAFGSRREGGGLFVMGATGESPRQVSDRGFDPAWSPDGSRLVYTTERILNPYSRTGTAHLWVVQLDTLDRHQLGDIDAAGAAWSPSGRRIAFWTHQATVQGQRDIWTMASDGSDPVPVMEDVATDWHPLWSPDGRWLYFISDRGGRPDLWRVPIDEASGKTRGHLEPVTSGVSYISEASLAADGQRIALTVRRTTGEISAATFDPDAERMIGEPTTLLTSTNAFIQLRVSDDGDWIAYRTSAPRESIYVMRSDGSARRKILDDEHRNRGPVWSRDGRHILFYSNRGGSYDAWAMRANGTGLVQLTNEKGDDVTTPVWSSDGEFVLYPLHDANGSRLVKRRLGPDGIEAVTAPLEYEEESISIWFSGGEVSPNGKFFSGPAMDPSGELTVGLLQMESGEGQLLTRADGTYFRVGDSNPTWLDDSRFAFWDPELDTAVVWDMRRNESRQIPGLPGPSDLDFTSDGRRVFFNMAIEESDIWLLTLEEHAE